VEEKMGRQEKEFNKGLEYVRQLANRGDYSHALDEMEILDMSYLSNARDYSLVAKVYEENDHLIEAISYYEKSLAKFQSASVLKRLIDLCIEERQFVVAADYLKEYREVDPADTDSSIFQYKIDVETGKTIDVLIEDLETYIKDVGCDDYYGYVLALLYIKKKKYAKCKDLCDNIVLWFDGSDYADYAKQLKSFIEDYESGEEKPGRAKMIKQFFRNAEIDEGIGGTADDLSEFGIDNKNYKLEDAVAAIDREQEEEDNRLNNQIPNFLKSRAVEQDEDEYEYEEDDEPVDQTEEDLDDSENGTNNEVTNKAANKVVNKEASQETGSFEAVKMRTTEILPDAAGKQEEDLSQDYDEEKPSPLVDDIFGDEPVRKKKNRGGFRKFLEFIFKPVSDENDDIQDEIEYQNYLAEKNALELKSEKQETGNELEKLDKYGNYSHIDEEFEDEDEPSDSEDKQELEETADNISERDENASGKEEGDAEEDSENADENASGKEDSSEEGLENASGNEGGSLGEDAKKAFDGASEKEPASAEDGNADAPEKRNAFEKKDASKENASDDYDVKLKIDISDDNDDYVKDIANTVSKAYLEDRAENEAKRAIEEAREKEAEKRIAEKKLEEEKRAREEKQKRLEAEKEAERIAEEKAKEEQMRAAQRAEKEKKVELYGYPARFPYLTEKLEEATYGKIENADFHYYFGNLYVSDKSNVQLVNAVRKFVDGTGNYALFISCNDRFEGVKFAKSFVKMAVVAGIVKDGKCAITDAAKVNNDALLSQGKSLYGKSIIIEGASGMMEKTVDQLISFMGDADKPTPVILVDSFAGMGKIYEGKRQFTRIFENRLIIKDHNVNEYINMVFYELYKSEYDIEKQAAKLIEEKCREFGDYKSLGRFTVNIIKNAVKRGEEELQSAGKKGLDNRISTILVSDVENASI
jgi:predicted transcriptional regulator